LLQRPILESLNEMPRHVLSYFKIRQQLKTFYMKTYSVFVGTHFHLAKYPKNRKLFLRSREE
jgi:hypothetical protein